MSKRFLYFSSFLLVFIFISIFIYASSEINTSKEVVGVDYELIYVEFDLDSQSSDLDLQSSLEENSFVDSFQNFDYDLNSYFLEEEDNNHTFMSIVEEDYSCPQHIPTALNAGWSQELLDKLDIIMWRESRCIDDAFNSTDPNGGSHGVTQVNGFWCRPSRYFPEGWLQDQDIVSTCQDLYDTYTNLLAAKAIYDYSKERNNCGFSPWSTKDKRWC